MGWWESSCKHLLPDRPPLRHQAGPCHTCPHSADALHGCLADPCKRWQPSCWQGCTATSGAHASCWLCTGMESPAGPLQPKALLLSDATGSCAKSPTVLPDMHAWQFDCRDWLTLFAQMLQANKQCLSPSTSFQTCTSGKLRAAPMTVALRSLPPRPRVVMAPAVQLSVSLTSQWAELWACCRWYAHMRTPQETPASVNQPQQDPAGTPRSVLVKAVPTAVGSVYTWAALSKSPQAVPPVNT